MKVKARAGSCAQAPSAAPPQSLLYHPTSMLSHLSPLHGLHLSEAIHPYPTLLLLNSPSVPGLQLCHLFTVHCSLDTVIHASLISPGAHWSLYRHCTAFIHMRFRYISYHRGHLLWFGLVTAEMEASHWRSLDQLF